MPIISAALLVRVKSFGLRSMPASIGMWCMCSRPPTICTSSASATIACDACAIACRLLPHKPIDRRPARLDRQPAIRPTVRATLNPCSRCCCVLPEHDVFDRSRIDAAPLDQRAHHRHGQIIGADVAKDTLLRMSPANRRATSINDYGGFHSNSNRKQLNRRDRDHREYNCQHEIVQLSTAYQSYYSSFVSHSTPVISVSSCSI